MSDQQFKSSHHDRNTKKWENNRENMINESIERKQDEEENENQWYSGENITNEYTEEEQDGGEEAENQWYDENEGEQDEEENEDQWYDDGENIDDRYIDGNEEEEEEEEENKKRRRNTNKIADEYVDDEQQEEEEEENKKRRRNTNKIADEYVDDEQQEEEEEENKKRRRNTNKIADEYVDDEQQEEEEQQFETKEQTGQTPRFGLMYRLSSQYKEFIATVGEQSGQAPRFSFRRLLSSQYKELAASACFLSILPFPEISANVVNQIPTSSPDESGPLERLSFREGTNQLQHVRFGSAYFPLIGLVIALIACLLPLAIGPSLHLPPLVLAALLTIALVCLTGGLHLDGLIDTCDGLFSGSRRERKLEIMRDSRVGAFGVLGGICILLLKFAIFASLADPKSLALALLIALPISRWAIVLAIYILPNARPDGFGAVARRTVTRPRLLIAMVISLLVALFAGHLIGFAVWMGGTLVPIVLGTWISYVLGGLTGDVYGALAETTEVVCLLMFVAMH